MFRANLLSVQRPVQGPLGLIFGRGFSTTDTLAEDPSVFESLKNNIGPEEQMNNKIKKVLLKQSQGKPLSTSENKLIRDFMNKSSSSQSCDDTANKRKKSKYFGESKEGEKPSSE